MVPAIKVYKMDYSFIIRNYLNPKLWKKVWTLFEYKDFVITIQIASIDTIRNKVVFMQKLKDNSGNCTYGSDSNNIEYSLKGSSIEFLIKNINGTILRSILFHERYHVLECLNVYKEAKKLEELQETKLREYANEFLDNEGVNNSDIREAYIDAYVSENTKNEYTQELRSAYEYHLLTDLYLVFLKSINDEVKYQNVLNRLEENEIDNVLKEIKEYEEYIETEEYEEEMTNLLETI